MVTIQDLREAHKYNRNLVSKVSKGIIACKTCFKLFAHKICLNIISDCEEFRLLIPIFHAYIFTVVD